MNEPAQRLGLPARGRNRRGGRSADIRVGVESESRFGPTRMSPLRPHAPAGGTRQTQSHRKKRKTLSQRRLPVVENRQRSAGLHPVFGATNGWKPLAMPTRSPKAIVDTMNTQRMKCMKTTLHLSSHLVGFLLAAKLCLAQEGGGLVDLIHRASTTHSYAGPDSNTGPNSIDGNFTTAQESATERWDGGFDIASVSEHIFVAPRLVRQIKYRLSASAYSYSDYDSQHSAGYCVQYSTDGSSWTDVPGTRSGCADNGDGQCGHDSGEITANVNLSHVVKIRAVSEVHGLGTGGNGHANGEAKIFEIQAFTVPDLPGLSIGLTNGLVLISWPELADGYVLETVGILGVATNWTAVTNLPVVHGDRKEVLLAPADVARFYRLKWQ